MKNSKINLKSVNLIIKTKKEILEWSEDFEEVRKKIILSNDSKKKTIQIKILI